MASGHQPLSRPLFPQAAPLIPYARSHSSCTHRTRTLRTFARPAVFRSIICVSTLRTVQRPHRYQTPADPPTQTPVDADTLTTEHDGHHFPPRPSLYPPRSPLPTLLFRSRTHARTHTSPHHGAPLTSQPSRSRSHCASRNTRDPRAHISAGASRAPRPHLPCARTPEPYPSAANPPTTERMRFARARRAHTPLATHAQGRGRSREKDSRCPARCPHVLPLDTATARCPHAR